MLKYALLVFLVAAMAAAPDVFIVSVDTLRADRMSALTQWDWPWREAMLREWTEGRERLADALTGAARFAAGAGRHGQF